MKRGEREKEREDGWWREREREARESKKKDGFTLKKREGERVPSIWHAEKKREKASV